MQLEGFDNIVAIDEGGFGSVFGATRSSTGGKVAIKVLDQIADADDDTLERRIDREIAALVALKGHPNVVQVEQVVSTPRGPAIVMEFMDGGSVCPPEKGGTLTPDEVAQVGIAIGTALQAAHDAGIIHRDVKPKNVLKNSFGQIKLCDFGIAAVSSPKARRTRTASLSLHYASPEELDEADEVGPPTDVFSLGATLFHLLVGKPPSFRTTRSGITGSTPGSIDASAHYAALMELCERCMTLEPERRPTATQVCEEIAGAMSSRESNFPTRDVDDSPEAALRNAHTIRRSDLEALRAQDRPPPAPSSPPVPPTPPRGGADGLPTTYQNEWWRDDQ